MPCGFGATTRPADCRIDQVGISVQGRLKSALQRRFELRLVVGLLALHSLALREFDIVDIRVPEIHAGIMTCGFHFSAIAAESQTDRLIVLVVPDDIQYGNSVPRLRPEGGR